jgi:hypothetical protein
MFMINHECRRHPGRRCPIEADDLSDSEDYVCPLGNVVKVKCCTSIDAATTTPIAVRVINDIRKTIRDNKMLENSADYTLMRVEKGLDNIEALIIKGLYQT